MDNEEIIAEAIKEAAVGAFISHAERDQDGGSATVVDGLFAIARGLDAVAKSIHRLGNADAMTPMGGLEALGKVIGEASERIANAMSREA